MQAHSKHAIRALLCLLLAAAGTSANALDGATLYKEKTCVSCHGENGNNPVLPAYPKLGGQNPEYLFQQLKDIKSGVRTNAMTAAMQGIIQNVDMEEMRVIAIWLGTLSAE
ncbi:MAG: c-type cytochrome [Gammaproteobacteria bacterium]|nr:c-type cytochrome [Gammaproteobacteria bacterium]MCB1922966.1 c-type cytochrome [Gammaproteobacteria bacterium]